MSKEGELREERLREGLILLIDSYDLPRNEVRAMLLEEDYPPLEPGDLDHYEYVLYEEEW